MLLRWIPWINFVAGLYLIATPFIFGMMSPALTFTSMALGIVVLITAFLTWYGTVVLRRDYFSWLSWVNVVLGLFTIVMPYAFAFGRGTMVSYIVTGIVIVVVAFFHWFGAMVMRPTTVRP